MNLETGELLYSVRRLMKMVKKPNKTFDVYVQEVEGNDFIATFVDQETGKEYEVNTLKASASIWCSSSGCG